MTESRSRQSGSFTGGQVLEKLRVTEDSDLTQPIFANKGLCYSTYIYMCVCVCVFVLAQTLSLAELNKLKSTNWIVNYLPASVWDITVTKKSANFSTPVIVHLH